MSYPYCYVEFEASTGDALSRIQALIERLRKDFAAGEKQEAEWVGFLTDEELSTFWWPNQAQFEEVRSRWGDVPIRICEKVENKQTDWDVYSMFEIIETSEYELEGIKEVGPGLFHLAFVPRAFPYGGTESLRRLVRAFGLDVVGVDDGTGRVDPRKLPEAGATRPSSSTQKKWWQLWK